MSKSPLTKFLLFFVTPLFYMVPGIIYAQNYSNQIDYISLGVLFVFIVLHAIIEEKIRQPGLWWSPTFLFIELINLGILIYLFLNGLHILAFIFILYSGLIHLQYLFKYYGLYLLAVFLLTLFKVLVLNAVAFYLVALFIPNSVFTALIPFILPFSLVELVRFGMNKPMVRLSIILASFAVGILFYAFSVGFSSLLLILAFPIVYITLKRNDLQGSLLFASVFSLFCLILMFI